MGAQATFSFSTFALRYPEFTSINPSVLQLYWDEATLYLRNDGSGPVQDPTRQAMLLGMATAHIAKLNAYMHDEEPSPLVGRIASAGEGSVNVSVENSYPPGSAQWWQQTKYGAAFWAATAPYRGFRYLPRRTRIVDPWRPY